MKNSEINQGDRLDSVQSATGDLATISTEVTIDNTMGGLAEPYKKQQRLDYL